MRRFLSLFLCSLIVLGACQCQETEEFDVPEKSPVVISTTASKFVKLDTVQSTTHATKNDGPTKVTTTSSTTVTTTSSTTVHTSHSNQ